MQNKKKFLSRYIMKHSSSNSSSTALPLRTDTQSSILYRNIVDLPLYLFIDAIVDDKVHSIVISGHPTAEEISAAWQELVTQYNESMGDNESRLFFSLHKQIVHKNIDIERVELGCEILKGCYVKAIEKNLNDIFFTNVTLDCEDRESYLNQLQVFKNRSKSIVLDRDMKLLQYNEIKAKNENSASKPTRQYFITIRMNLSNHAKYEVTDQISVFEFCERVQALNKYCESLNEGK